MFGAQETKDTCRVAIMAEPTAESWFGGRAVGRVIEDPAGNPVEVIGVCLTEDPVVRFERSPARHLLLR